MVQARVVMRAMVRARSVINVMRQASVPVVRVQPNAPHVMVQGRKPVIGVMVVESALHVLVKVKYDGLSKG